MKTNSGLKAAILTMVAGALVIGGTPAAPTVVTEPGTKTIIHDRTPPAPNVTVVNPPAESTATHTDTNTTTTTPSSTDPNAPDPAPSSTNTSTTTTGN